MRAFQILFAIVLTGTASTAFADSYLLLRTGLTDGNATFQGSASGLAGGMHQLELGWDPGVLFSLGAVGHYETPTLKDRGQLETLGYGLALRLYFLSPLYFLGVAGQGQSKLTDSATGSVRTSSGIFYLMGSGLALRINPALRLDVGLGIRTMTFSDGMLENVRSLYYTLGLQISL